MALGIYIVDCLSSFPHVFCCLSPKSSTASISFFIAFIHFFPGVLFYFFLPSLCYMTFLTHLFDHPISWARIFAIFFVFHIICPSPHIILRIPMHMCVFVSIHLTLEVGCHPCIIKLTVNQVTNVSFALLNFYEKRCMYIFA